MNNKPNHTDRAHAEFGPSGMKYIAACSGFESRGGTNEAAEKGTRIHEALDVEREDLLHDEEELYIYNQILEAREDLVSSIFPDGGEERHSEIRLNVDLDVHDPHFGTCDFLAVKGDTALLIDYKTGISLIDEVPGNWQCKSYTIGVFQKYPKVKKIVFGFLAPMAHDEPLVGTFTRAKDYDTLVADVTRAIRKAEVPRAKWRNGVTPELEELDPHSGCRFCKHEEHCPAQGYLAVNVAREIADHSSASLLGGIEKFDPESLTDSDQAEKLYTLAKLVKSWAEAVEARVKKMAFEDGVEFKGLVAKESAGSAVTEDALSLANLARGYGLSEEEILQAAKPSVSALATAIGIKAKKGEKKALQSEFRREAMDLGAVKAGAPRKSLVERR